MEGVAYALKHNLDTALESGAAVGTMRAMGGSANIV
jgi:sugar (pentulose or hexulose) kinase